MNNIKSNVDNVVTTIASNLVSAKSVFGNITKPATVNTFSNLAVADKVEGKFGLNM